MPRRVDVAVQRRQLTDAVTRLIARSGLEAVSLRSVAAEAGVSMGRVQHYFSSKEELLLATVRAAYARIEQRVEARLAETSGTEQDVLWAVLEELLGADPDTRDAIRLNLAFALRTDDPVVMGVLTDGDEAVLGLAASVLSRPTGPPGAPPRQVALEARAVLALAMGLGVQVALYDLPADVARAVLRHHLDGPPPSVG